MIIGKESSRSQELEPAYFLELQRILVEKEPNWIDRELQPEGRLRLSERVVDDGRKKRTHQIVSIRKPEANA